MKIRFSLLTLGFLSVSITACTRTPVQSKTPIATNTPTAAPPTQTPFQPQAATSTSLVLPTFTPTTSPTPDPLAKYTIASMRERSYGEGTLQLLEKLNKNSSFTRYKFLYSSDGIPIYGFVNIPKGEGFFPVVIAIHGNYNPSGYQLLAYTTYYADRLASQGYVVFHPNLRNYGESGQGDDRYRTGLAADVLNLIGLLKAPVPLTGELSKTTTDKLGIWAHSMGGEVALRVLTISDQVDAVVLYAPMSGNLIKIATFIDSQIELDTPPYLIPTISIDHSYGLITSPIKLFHGTSDSVVPVSWSRETCATLDVLGKEINCTFVEGGKHTFNGIQETEFERRYFSFFENHLKTP